MDKNSNNIFQKLKEEVIKTFLEVSEVQHVEVSKWGVNDIQQFQDHLLETTKSSVSEKWFYTYFKNEPEKLPRIDMLNILSMYCGYNNWAEFKEKNEKIEEYQKKSKQKIILISAGIASIIITGILVWLFNREYEYKFCFIDDNTDNPIETPIEIIILQNGESPYFLKTIDKGCFTWKSKQQHLIAIINSPYHLTDTLYRTVHSRGNESIKLRTDDYALMIHYYSTANVADWKKRRSHLREIIHQDALIYQVHPNGVGIELYSKEDFINKLTLPTSTLKNIDIIDTEYSGKKISSLKFKLKQDDI